MKKAFKRRKKKAELPKKRSFKTRQTEKRSFKARQAGVFLASTCFAGAFLVICITVGSLAGCSMGSLFPESSTQSVQESQNTQNAASAAGQGNTAGPNVSQNGDVFPEGNTDAGVSYNTDGSIAAGVTYSADGIVVAEDTYTANGNVTANGSYAADGSYIGDGSYAADGSYIGDGSYAADGIYTGDGSYAADGSYTGDGSYAADGSFIGDGSYAADGSYTGDGSYAADGSYTGDGSYAADGSFIGDSSYAADGSYIGDGSYAADGSFIGDGYYAADGSFIGDGAVSSSDGGLGIGQDTVQTTVSEPALTLPYDESDPAEMASAYNWICSDLIDNANKLGNLSETDDFHAAVNSDWLSSNSIPSGYITYDSFAERQLEVDKEILEILESDTEFSDPYIAHCQKLVRDYYNMWLDWDARDAAGVTPLLEILAPLQNVTSLDEMTAYLSDPETTIKALPLSSSFTAANPNDADSIAVYITPPSLTFQDPMYYSQLDSDSWKTQPRYMYAAGYMLERLGYSESEKNMILRQSYEFECEMAKYMMTTEEQNAEDASTRTNNPRTLQELEAEQGNFPLTGMLQGAGLYGSDVYILQEPEWLEGMSSLYDNAHLDKIKSYLLVQDALQFMELLDHDCYNQMIKVRNILSGSSGQVDDRKAACDAVNSVLEMELGDVYAETYITDTTRNDVTALIDDIIAYYRIMLENEDFLSDSTKAEALRKLDNLTVRVASPEERVNEFSLMDNEETIISGSTSDSSDSEEERTGRTRTQVIDFRGPEEGGSLVEARIAISQNVTIKMASEVNQPVDRSDWIAAPQEVNAYYYPLDNSINIPAGILGGNFYSDTMAYEEKLGHIGTMIAHEISHAFDTSGRQYDESGNLRNWWTEDDYRRFHARAQKLVDYYNGFEPITGFKVKGAMLDTEAIADLTGVKCMLQIAADDYNFNYDLFFRTLATNWRCLTTLETEAYCIEQDSHPLAYLRTNAVVVQFEEFHQTYGTQEGDGMYLAPEYRLEVW